MNTQVMTAHVQYAQNIEDVTRCFDVVSVLRPHLEKNEYVDQVIEQFREGYEMIFIEADGRPVAFAGFRRMTNLFAGRFIYIDDLSTLPEYRRHGFGRQLLDYIHQLARREGRKAVHLDSGYQRKDAHRLYLNSGYVVHSHHFVNDLSK